MNYSLIHATKGSAFKLSLEILVISDKQKSNSGLLGDMWLSAKLGMKK